ncbi:MAG TPA: hypothetical protein VIK78_04055 [Ruminiclostridium sp.]
MECIDSKMNIIAKLLKKTGLISVDFIYRMYFMPIFGSRLYFRHKISSFRSCAFCQHLSYDKVVKKYVCSHGEYEACSSLIPCIIPDSSFMFSKSYLEEEEQIPWLFKESCLNFDVLNSKKYFRNFLSLDLNSSVIKLEALEGILLGSCSGEIPCHICACVNKEDYARCTHAQKANKVGKCGIIYDNLSECFSTSSAFSNVS